MTKLLSVRAPFSMMLFRIVALPPFGRLMLKLDVPFGQSMMREF